MKRPAAPSAHARMHALRGVKCHICGDIGKHYSSSCPQRVNVGVPLGLRPDVDAGGEPKTEDDKKESPACSVYVPPAYLDAQELTAIIRKSPELPAFLRCRACLALPLDAIWCQCCDIFACSACLGPPDEAWVCPLCATYAVDNFHVVAAVRKMVDTWFQAAATQIDPYSVSSDEEDAVASPTPVARVAKKRARGQHP